MEKFAKSLIKSNKFKIVLVLFLISIFIFSKNNHIQNENELQFDKISKFMNIYLENQSDENVEKLIKLLPAKRNMEFIQSSDFVTTHVSF